MLTSHCLDAVKNHQKFFGNQGNDQEADDHSVGSAAAMQALKMFSGGGSGNSQVSWTPKHQLVDLDLHATGRQQPVLLRRPSHGRSQQGESWSNY